LAVERQALELFAAGGELLVEAWRLVRARPWLVLIALAVLAGLWCAAHPWDETVNAAVLADADAHTVLAVRVRKFGAFIDICVWTALTLSLGILLRRPRWRRAAVACFLAACLAGLTANLVRPTAGRARPNAEPVASEAPGGFTGFSLRRYDHQSFPSGHTSTSFGGAVALCVVFPPLGVIAVGEAASVGWACSYCRAHWLSDIAVGGGLGLSYGLLLGTAHWRIERRRAAAGS
jgi:membrane-associated phospholipid phosphatase